MIRPPAQADTDPLLIGPQPIPASRVARTTALAPATLAGSMSI